MMSPPPDDGYARKVLQLARADAERAVRHPECRAWRSVAMFMVDELAKVAAGPGLPSGLSSELGREVRSIRERLARRGGSPVKAATAA